MSVRLMGVLNVTPDSFSDGGEYFSAVAAVRRAQQMLEDGADIIDVGGESTRPGAEPVTAEEELRRVIPVIEQITGVVSIDTSKPEVAERALGAGATVLNDVTGFRNPEMLDIAARHEATICIMHMLGEPRTMQKSPAYEDVVQEVRDFLVGQADIAQKHGVPKSKIWLDPGIGFGKTLEHNLALLRSIPVLVETGYHILIGASRKSFIGAISGESDPSKRLPGSLAVALHAARLGAHVLRVHDVGETRQALAIQERLG